MKPFHLLVLTSLFFVSGCIPTKAQDKSPVLARFEGQAITETQFTEKMKTLPEEFRAFVAGHKKEFLDDMISEYYLLKEAKRLKIEESREVRDLLEAAHRKILVAKLVESQIDQKISLAPDEAERYYDSHQEEFMTPLTFRASHILVKTAEEASEIRRQIDQGADFEELARTRSVDATAIRGGDLGFFRKGQFIPEFEAIVESMKKGEIRGPEETSRGFHIVKLTDRLEPALREFKSVRPLVEQRLLNEKRSRSFKSFVEKLKGSAKIDVDEKALESVRVS